MRQKKESKLYFFEKFIETTFRETTVSETNKYVREILNKPSPPSYNPLFPWPLKWVSVFQQFTE
eukprot:3088512-Rhodomonas_salina.1